MKRRAKIDNKIFHYQKSLFLGIVSIRICIYLCSVKRYCVREFMQTAKEYTRKILLKTARETFLRKGFKATSMREISKLSGVGLSNIYNYYSCKDDLLAAILHPLFEAMDTMLENHNRPEFVSIEVFTSEECHRAYVHNFIDIVICYREECKLLFFKSQDSRYENYWERWIEKGIVIGKEYMNSMKNVYPSLHTSVSPFFLRFICSWQVNMMREVIMQEKTSAEEIERFISEYVRFNIGGWEKLMRDDERIIV